VTAFDVVPARRHGQVLAALADGRLIAVPSDGGYMLAIRLDRFGEIGRLHARAPSLPDGGPPHVVVGRRAQAIELCSSWSNDTRRLTDRMWPGPLDVIVATRREALIREGAEPRVQISMPRSRVVRVLCRKSGPLIVVPLYRTDGRPMTAFADVRSLCAGSDEVLGIDGGTCDGAGPTVVDCTVSPPVVRRVGELPESYVDAAMMMSARRRRRFARGTALTPPVDGVR
jgi:tRNA A37 threonylcarbamoyladenosine synthetase subunit TsaC/SUA5/YrdC